MKNSTMILLPQWYKTLCSCTLPPRMMPCDAATQWNSTYDMLHIALDFHTAIDVMTSMCEFHLRKYELSPAEWGIAKELRDILKVTFSFAHMFITQLLQIFSKVQPSSFLAELMNSNRLG